ncbi:MAG: hypothetical protein HC815_05775 [Richelia sp. RM1_1_1]|nr:hypothetical protein [Richelia sp. RM1_1_1]
MDGTEIQKVITGISTFAWEKDYRQFCQVCGFNPEHPYSEEKWRDFKELNRLLGRFDNKIIIKIVRTGLKLPLLEEAETF